MGSHVRRSFAYLFVVVAIASARQLRLGVVAVLAYGETTPPASSFWLHETTLCTVLANLEATAAVLRRTCALDATIEPMVMTVRDTMPDSVAQFFSRANLPVRDAGPSARRPLDDNGKPNNGTRWLQAVKAHVVRLIEYDAVLVVDCDIFMNQDWNWDIFGEVLNSSQRFILQTGHISPINAGFFVVKPAVDLAKRLDDALMHGFRPDDDFWGGSYSSDIVALGKDRKPEAHFNGWRYLGSETDQGLLLHLIASEPQDPNQLIRNLKGLHMLHLAGVSPKTWFPDPILDQCKSENTTEALLCYGDHKLRSELSFWKHWMRSLHNQDWTTKSRQHVLCDKIMDTEFNRRKGILGEAFYHPKKRY